MRLIKKLLSVSILTLSLSALLTGVSAADPSDSSDANGIRSGQVLQVPVGSLHPTQFRVGYFEVDRKEAKFREKGKGKLDRYIEEHEVPVVVGPDGKTLYMTDFHHRMSALMRIDDQMLVNVRVVASYPAYRETVLKDGARPMSFPKWMVANNYVFLLDRGVLRLFKELPDRLGQLKNDAYRSLIGSLTEEELTFEGEGAYFAEFKMANWLRALLNISDAKIDGYLHDQDSKESAKFISGVEKLLDSDGVKEEIAGGKDEAVFLDSRATCIVGRIQENLHP